MVKISVNKNCLIGIVLFLCISFLISLGINESYTVLAWISIAELALSIIFIKYFGGYNLFTLPTFFLLFTWAFHCGQIILKGFGIEGYMPLDFTRYAVITNQIRAFKFYYFAVVLITIGIILARNSGNNERDNQYIDGKRTSQLFVLIGIIPRLYVDARRLIGGIISGYQGVYTIYIPQMINTLAFFFDIGVVIKLLHTDNVVSRRRLFWAVVIYKSIAMLTGSRQSVVAFLVIWFYLYYFKGSKLSIKKIVSLLVVALAGITLLNAIRNTRSISSFRVGSLFNYITSSGEGMSSIISGFLGEFGSAFCSLEVPFQQIPSTTGFGFGKSYLAGLLSVIPMLTSAIPSLASETTFITKFEGTTYFGGSF